jgi:hypothetical protein
VIARSHAWKIKEASTDNCWYMSNQIERWMIHDWHKAHKLHANREAHNL